MQTELDKYNHSLDLALMDYVIGKTEKFDAHCKAFDLTGKLPANPIAKTGAVMKMITARTNLPMWARKEAKRWLTVRGYQSWDDGDVPTSP